MNIRVWQCVSAKWWGRSLRLGNLSIAKRLSLGFGLVLALFAGTACFAVYKMTALDIAMKNAIQSSNEIAGQAVKMKDSIWRVNTNMLLVSLVKQKEDLAFQSEDLSNSMLAYDQNLAAFKKMTSEGSAIAGLPPLMAKLADAQQAVKTQMESLLSRCQERIANAKPDGALDYDPSLQSQAAYASSSQVIFWSNAATEVADLAAKVGRQAAAEARDSAQLARTVLIVAAGVALMLSVAAAWLIARSVTRPLHQAVAMAERVARGDLSQAIEVTTRDETGALLEALARMQHALHTLVGEVQDAAHAIELASSEVASGNGDLSHRTELTASNLQRTASSMNHLTDSVRQSARSANDANARVRSAVGAAERGGEVVSEVVTNMQEIAAQSARISDIIGVIDGIAFQTNILALNAAVEAARAGEQGRGFAVVAGEVRTLAQRSAAAAKDIKTLISNSVEKVESGSRLVVDAGRVMDELVVSVRDVTDMIGAISRSSDEQSGGLARVNDSVDQLERMTQQNAALVEQSAAAAESLKLQARRMSEAVSVFNL